MRIISSDGAINVPYERNIICVVNDEENNTYHLGIRSNVNPREYMPLADYDTRDAAIDKLAELSTFAQDCDVNSFFKL